jgi:mono/diheme cytochrome c family protein
MTTQSDNKTQSNMKSLKRISLLAVLCAAPVVMLIGAGGEKQSTTERVARGKYLVNFGGCNDCHTPLKFTDKGPEPDMARMLSGHPEDVKLPPPDLKPGPWFAATAGMTAWAGPWGTSYAANLTPDTNTGPGAWTEDMFAKTMKTGRHMGAGRKILPPMPWQDMGTLRDEDLKAIYAYLRTVPAITNHVPDARGPHGETTFD